MIRIPSSCNKLKLAFFYFTKFLNYFFLDFNVDWGGQPSMAKYFEENPKGLPDHDAAIGCQVLLLQLFSVGIWRKLLTFLDADGDGEVSTEELKALDIDGKYLLNTQTLPEN